MSVKSLEGTSVVRVCRYVGAVAPLRILWACTAGALAAGCGVGLLATSGWLITRASLRPPVLSLSIAIGAVQAFALCRGIARYMERLALHDVSLSFLGKLRLFLFDTLEPLVPGGLGANRSGSLLSAFVSDCDSVVDTFARSLGAAIDTGTSVALGLLLAILVDPAAAAALALGVATILAVVTLCARLGRSASETEASLRGDHSDSVVEAVRNAPELVVYGRQDLVLRQLARIASRSSSATMRRAVSNGLGRALVTIGAAGTLVAVVAVGSSAHDTHRLSAVLLTVLVFDTLAVLESAGSLPAAFHDLTTGSSAVRRLRALARLTPTVTDDDTTSVTLPGDIEGHLVDAEVALVAAQVRGNEGAVLLDDANLSVGSGERAFLVGPSGAGKTSAVLALLHFLECCEGHALVGGTDVRSLSRRQLAAKTGWLDEEPHVFSASLVANLRIADRAATDERCREALVAVGLDELLDSLPAGLETRLGAGGRALSAGERQRLAMARALLSGGDVLLLDEPEAHIDARSSSQLLFDLLTAAGRRTVLVTSHVPCPAVRPDRVFCVEGGRIRPLPAE